MLTRRSFAGVASCAICGLTGFIATEALAQGAPTTPGVTRKILSQTDGPAPGYVTIIAEVEIEPGVTVARHTHPGIESGYVLEGGFDLPIQGQPTRTLKPGEAFQMRPRRLMPAARTVTKRRGSQSPLSSRRASRWRLPPDPNRGLQRHYSRRRGARNCRGGGTRVAGCRFAGHLYSQGVSAAALRPETRPNARHSPILPVT
jgi:hypothetical protein